VVGVEIGSDALRQIRRRLLDEFDRPKRLVVNVGTGGNAGGGGGRRRKKGPAVRSKGEGFLLVGIRGDLKIRGGNAERKPLPSTEGTSD